MRVAFTPDAFATQRYGGVTRYVTELAAHLSALDDCDVTVLGMLHLNEHLRSMPRPLRASVVATYVPHIPLTGRLRRALNASLARRYLARHPVDVVHETYYARRGVAPAGAKTVLTVYDMTHERHPESFPAGDPTRELKRAAVARADHVICISEATRADLVELLHVDPKKTSVVHLGTSLGSHASPSPLHAFPTPFLLYVGDRRGYKNFAAVRQALRGIPLVCYGGGPLRPDEGGNGITQLAGGDDLLVQPYQQAAALVYPSLSEGFGMPVLEAMACGCPVACANRGSLPEIAAGAAELFDPTEPASIAAAIERVLSPGRAAELRRLGAERAKQFTWEKCAAETRAAYRSLCTPDSSRRG